MAILIDANTRLLVQGMTGWAGTHYTAIMREYGTHIVGGVTPGKGGQRHLDVPVFNDIGEAARETKANASVVFVPPATAARAMIEAIEAEMPLVVAVTERVPVLDMLRVRQALAGSRTRLVGPNSQGVLSPGQCKVGVMATASAQPGNIGIVSRSASLTSEVTAQVSAQGLGQSTTVGIGGDPVHGMSMKDCVELFLADPGTQGLILIGEIGGSEEQEVAELLKARRPQKPVVALVVGAHAPQERRMGHAGAMLLQGQNSAKAKMLALEAAGVILAAGPHVVGQTMAQAMSAARLVA